IPVIEQAIETAALMLGTDKSRGYCLGMNCADFLAGAHLRQRQPGDPPQLDLALLQVFARQTAAGFPRNPAGEGVLRIIQSKVALAAGSLVVRKSAPADPASRWMEVSILWHLTG